MTIRQPRYSPEEHARRGDDIYERSVRPQVEAGNQGKIVAIDIDTGAFEVAADVLTASDRLLARHPNAQTWGLSALDTVPCTALVHVPSRRRYDHWGRDRTGDGLRSLTFGFGQHGNML